MGLVGEGVVLLGGGMVLVGGGQELSRVHTIEISSASRRAAVSSTGLEP